MLEALGQVKRYPDLVVADLRRACGESGIAVVHKMRDELGIALPALLVSGISARDRRDARMAGLMLLPKPGPRVLRAITAALVAQP